MRILLFILVLSFEFIIPKGIYANKSIDFSGMDNVEKARFYIFNNIDSAAFFINRIENELTKTGNKDVSEYFTLKGLYLTQEGENDTALSLFRKALRVSKNNQDIAGTIESLLNIGEIYYNWAEYDTALHCFITAYGLSKSSNNIHYQIQSLNYIGKYHHSVGNFKESIGFYESGHEMAEKSGDTLELMMVKNKMGKHFETLGNYSRALELYLESENLIKNINSSIEIATTHNHLGNIYHNLKDFDKASYFHMRALDKRKQMHYMEGEAKSLNNLGEVLNDMDLLDSAFVCFNQSYHICKEIGYVKGMIKSVHNIGVVNKKRNSFDTSVDDFKTALNLSQEISYDKGILSAYFQLADISRQIGHMKQAMYYAESGLNLSKHKNVRSTSRDFYQLLASIYETEGNTEKALYFFKQYHEINEIIANTEAKNKIAELQTQYEVKLKQQENDVLKQENEIQDLMIKRKNSYILLFGIILGLLVLLVFFIFSRYSQKQRANQKLTRLNDEVTLKNGELDKLNKELEIVNQQQIKLFSIIAHELRNPLWWFRNLIQLLSSKIENLDKKMISKSLESLNESATNTFHLMDNLLHWSRSQLGNIKYRPESFELNEVITENITLISHFADYKNIQITFLSDVSYQVFADKNMTRTIVRNLLSNAIKFTPENGKIDISTRNGSDNIKTKIKDTGIGMDETTLQQIYSSTSKDNTEYISKDAGAGLGLVLTREFVEINKGRLTAKSTVNQGSVFEFSLPLSN